MWTFVLKWQPKGEQTLWDRLSQAVKELHPEVAEVRFEWTGPAQEPRQEEEHEPEDVYLENAIKQVNGRPTNYGPPLPNGNGRSNGRSRSLLKSSIPGNPVPIAQLQEPQEQCGGLGGSGLFRIAP